MQSRADLVNCTDVVAAIPAILDRISEAPPAVIFHVESCVSCQAELARYRKLLRLLGQLRDEHVDTPQGVVTDVLNLVESQAHRRAIRATLSGHWFGYAAGLSVGAATAAAVVVVSRAFSTRSTRRLESRA